MMLQYEINQTLLARQFRLPDAWLRRLLRTVERILRLRGSYTLSIAFVDHRTMRRLNRKWRDKDRVTDILSFSGEEDDLGELLLAWPYVREQAKRNKKSLQEELALLLIHGVLHLRGFDHKTKADAVRMLPLQERILQHFLHP